MTGIIARNTGWSLSYIKWELTMRDAWALCREFLEADGVETISTNYESKIEVF
jgi:hypothetical protein